MRYLYPMILAFIANHLLATGWFFLAGDFLLITIICFNGKDPGVATSAMLVVLFAGAFICLMFKGGAFRAPIYQVNDNFQAWCAKNGGFPDPDVSEYGNYCTLPNGTNVDGNN